MKGSITLDTVTVECNMFKTGDTCSLNNNNIMNIVDNILDIDALTDEQEQVLNSISVEYGMRGMDYSEYVATSSTLDLLTVCLLAIFQFIS